MVVYDGRRESRQACGIMMRLNSGSRIRGAQALSAGASGRVHVNPFQVRISVVVCLFSLSSLHFQLDAEPN